MMTKTYSQQTAYLGGLFLLFACYSPANAATEQWYYNQKLASPADSRAILKPYYQPEWQQQNFVKYKRLKQWLWLKERNWNQVRQPVPTPYSAPKANQGRALPFWPDLN